MPSDRLRLLKGFRPKTWPPFRVAKCSPTLFMPGMKRSSCEKWPSAIAFCSSSFFTRFFTASMPRQSVP